MLFGILFSQSVWNLPLLATVTCLAVLYTVLVKCFTNTKMNQKQPIFFFLSLTLLYLTIGSPLATIGHLSFSTHMIQMSILYFMIPPMLLIGIPEQLFQRIKRISVIRKISKLFLPPMIALIVFGVLFFLYHLPISLDVVAQNPFIHNGYTILLIILSFSMWWPITAPDPKQRYDKDRRKRYVFLNGLILMPACVMLILSGLIGGANNPLLTEAASFLCMTSQTATSELLPFPFNTKFDQQIAGALMLGMHKISLMLTFRLEDGAHEQLKKKVS